MLALDLSDIRKEYAQKMEYLATVRDGSTGELHLGYWLCDVTGAEVNGSEIVPLYQKLFSVEAKEFTSENAEMLAAVDLIRTHTQGRGIWAIDRGGDRKKLLEPLLDRGARFVIRSTGKGTVIDRRNLQGSVAEVAGRCRLRHQARIIKIQDEQEKAYDLRYGAEPIPLPGRSEPLWLVVVAGFGEAPLMLLTNLPIAAKDSQSLWWIVQIYLTRWKIEETFRFIKQSYNLEDVRVMKYQRLKNLVILVTAVSLLRSHVSRTTDEAAHPLRKAADYLAALLRHSAVSVLCAGQWNRKNSLPRHLQSAGNTTRQPTDGDDPWLGGLRNSGETPAGYHLTRTRGMVLRYI